MIQNRNKDIIDFLQARIDTFDTLRFKYELYLYYLLVLSLIEIH